MCYLKQSKCKVKSAETQFPHNSSTILPSRFRRAKLPKTIPTNNSFAIFFHHKQKIIFGLYLQQFLHLLRSHLMSTNHPSFVSLLITKVHKNILRGFSFIPQRLKSQRPLFYLRWEPLSQSISTAQFYQIHRHDAQLTAIHPHILPILRYLLSYSLLRRYFSLPQRLRRLLRFVQNPAFHL